MPTRIPFLLIFALLFSACQPAAAPPPASPATSPAAAETSATATNPPTETETPAPSATPAWPLPHPTQPPTLTPMPSVTPDPNLSESLRSLAETRNLWIGAAVNNGLVQDAAYAAVLARQFNMLTTENAMKFEMIHPQPGVYTFEGADELVNFGRANNMAVRGHTLIWHKQLPAWLAYGEFTSEQLEQIMTEHISAVVGRYRGQVAVWDVVNEAIGDNRGNLRVNVWKKILGPEYIDMAFNLAHEADPNALLFYNDYDTEDMGGKSDGVYELVKGMKERSVPIDGVGMQFHVELGRSPNLEKVAENMKRLGELGLQVHITELDIAIPDPASAEQIEQQAQEYAALLKVCLDAGNCTAFITWGFTDKYSWIPLFKDGYGTALLFDENYLPKPAYEALQETLRNSQR